MPSRDPLGPSCTSLDSDSRRRLQPLYTTTTADMLLKEQVTHPPDPGATEPAQHLVCITAHHLCTTPTKLLKVTMPCSPVSRMTSIASKPNAAYTCKSEALSSLMTQARCSSFCHI